MLDLCCNAKSAKRSVENIITNTEKKEKARSKQENIALLTSTFT